MALISVILEPRLSILCWTASAELAARADHYVTLGRGQQEDLSVGIADEIEVPHDLERLGGRGPQPPSTPKMAAPLS
jgi:hypothetical protein